MLDYSPKSELDERRAQGKANDRANPFGLPQWCISPESPWASDMDLRRLLMEPNYIKRHLKCLLDGRYICRNRDEYQIIPPYHTPLTHCLVGLRRRANYK